MKSPYVKELQPNQTASGIFLVQAKDVRQKKSGEAFLSLTLSDRTGDIDAKMWDNVDRVMETFDRDDFVRVKGMPQVFQNRLQLTVHNLVRVSDSEVDFTDYFPASARDPEEMFAELTGIIETLRNEDLKGLLRAVFADAEIARKYKRAPAAKSIHHAWLGGLLEHVLSLCWLCRQAGAHYPHIDVDLLLAGAILHDIGKIDELAYDRSFQYTTDGQLLGHIIIGMRIVDDKLRRMPGFPARLRTLVQHMILSHHGSLEFGSPKVPLFGEALLLHHLDNLDSKMEAIRASVDNDRVVDGVWSAYNSSLERHVLKKDKYLEERPAAERPPHKPDSAFAGKLREALQEE